MENSPAKHLDKPSKTPYLILWFLCIVGSWAIIPYIQYLKIFPSSQSVLEIFLMSTIQPALFFGFVCFLSYKTIPKTDLEPFVVKDTFKQIILTSGISGALVGLIIYFLDKSIFQNSLLSEAHPPRWVGALASIYGAVNEEVLMRLFLFTFVYFIFTKLFQITAHSRLWFLWVVNVIVAIFFGLGHLPAAFKLISPSAFEIFRILLLNGIPGMIFGWLYFSRGIWAAMVAHLTADLMVHVFLA
jgi:membrane protease YdiL (CAAX protease family)